MRKKIVHGSLFIILFLTTSCQDKSRDDAKFLGHYETKVKTDELNTSYDSIDVTLDENDPEYPYLVTKTDHVKWFIDYFYGKKIDKKISDAVTSSENCQIKDGLLVSRTAAKHEIKFEVVEKDRKFVKFLYSINGNAYAGTIKK